MGVTPPESTRHPPVQVAAGAPRPRPAIQVSVESFELVGFPPAQRFAVTAAFEHELQRLLEVRGLPIAAGTGPAPARELPPAIIRVDPAGPAARAGRAIARAVYGRLR